MKLKTRHNLNQNLERKKRKVDSNSTKKFASRRGSKRKKIETSSSYLDVFMYFKYRVVAQEFTKFNGNGLNS